MDRVWMKREYVSESRWEKQAQRQALVVRRQGCHENWLIREYLWTLEIRVWDRFQQAAMNAQPLNTNRERSGGDVRLRNEWMSV